MTHPRRFRSFAVLASAALIVGAFAAAPADAKKKKKPKRCATYATPEWAGEAETTIVTDAATAEEPIEVELDTPPGLGFSSEEPGGGEPATGYTYHNVVVDSKSKTAAVWARIDFLPVWDYDLWFRYPDGSPAASAAGFGPIPGGEGGESGVGYEQVNGVAAADCDGFTAEIASATTPGGPVTLKLWLGEPGE